MKFYNLLTTLIISTFIAACAPDVGSIVKFGKIEQDNNYENGPEKIEWLVIADNGKQRLLVAKNGLAIKPFDDDSNIWIESDLRKWLNEQFLNESFSWLEKKRILSVPILTNEQKSDDSIFLLSDEQVKLFLKDKQARVISPSASLLANGLKGDKNGHVDWLLRTKKVVPLMIDCVNEDGDISIIGCRANNSKQVIRPALWIDSLI